MPLLTALPSSPAETDAERRDRQLGWLREMGELGMAVARNAAAQALDPQPGEPGRDDPAPNPTLDFARATRAVRQAIALENRVAAGDFAPRAPAFAPHAAAPVYDPRRAPLRQALHPLATAEPDRAARAQLRSHIDERIEDELAADPNGVRCLADAFRHLQRRPPPLRPQQAHRRVPRPSRRAP